MAIQEYRHSAVGLFGGTMTGILRGGLLGGCSGLRGEQWLLLGGLLGLGREDRREEAAERHAGEDTYRDERRRADGDGVRGVGEARRELRAGFARDRQHHDLLPLIDGFLGFYLGDHGLTFRPEAPNFLKHPDMLGTCVVINQSAGRKYLGGRGRLDAAAETRIVRGVRRRRRDPLWLPP